MLTLCGAARLQHVFFYFGTEGTVERPSLLCYVARVLPVIALELSRAAVAMRTSQTDYCAMPFFDLYPLPKARPAADGLSALRTCYGATVAT